MNIQVHINKKTISIKDRAFNYGDGLFETIHVKNNKPLFINDHIKRLNDGCKKLKIPRVSSKLIREVVKKAASKSNKCIIKIIYSRGLSGHGYHYDKNITPQLYVFKKSLDKSKKKAFINLAYSEYHIHENPYLSKIKHLNRIEQILGLSMKSYPQNDDYIMLDCHKKIIECISSNIFFYTYSNKTFKFITPSLATCGIEGVMKQQIIKFLKRKKIKIIEKDIIKKDIINFDGCFVCNVVKGVQFVNKIDKKTMHHTVQIEGLLKKYIYEK